jgi:uncharacterized protein (TIGR03118 family)
VRRSALFTVAAAVVIGAIALASAVAGRTSTAYVVHPLVSDGGVPAPRHDADLVNAWGFASGPTGPWWTSNEARDTSTLYSGSGRKQLLTVSVAGGPTGVVFYNGKGFPVAAGKAVAPSRFIYACEDGKIRAWSPTVPGDWSKSAEVVVDLGGEAAVFRGLAIATVHGTTHVYATDFHNAQVDVFDSHWRRVVRRGAFTDRSIPSWYAPFGIQAVGDHIFVTYIWRAPVDGNDAPTGGYVDEFDANGRLVARVGRMGALNAPWGVAQAPRSFGRFGGDLLVGDFGDGRINAFRPAGSGWAFAGTLRAPSGKPLEIDGLWGIAFGNGDLAGPADRLYFVSGPHQWRGETELAVHGLIGYVSAD